MSIAPAVAWQWLAQCPSWFPLCAAGADGSDRGCSAALVDSALRLLHVALRAAVAPLLRADVTVTALPPPLLPHAGDVFAARASLAVVSAAAASLAVSGRGGEQTGSER